MEHCDHCPAIECLDKEVKALFGRTGKLTTQVALNEQAVKHMETGIGEIKAHLGSQDDKLDRLQKTISRWGGAIAVIVAIPGVFAIIWSVTHEGKP
jgi:hypothetical protein